MWGVSDGQKEFLIAWIHATGRSPSIICTVTEIPEHLLKRSRERREAIGQGGDAPGDATAAPTAAVAKSASATPAAAPPPSGPAPRTAASEPAAPKPPKPDPQYVVAAKQRRKVPFWAMATLSLMPVWGFMYVRALKPSAEVSEGPVAAGAEIYGNCASCHGGAGGGGVGYAFTEGEVLKTFPNIEDQVRYVYYGTEQYNLAGVEIYGNPERGGGSHVTGEKGVMPGFGGQLSDYEIVEVICHERYTLGGADPTSEAYAAEFEAWCSADAAVFEAVEAGELNLIDLVEAEEFPVSGGIVVVNPVGPAPLPGLPGLADGG
jgi:mono/diheme cytochrome c family protein